MFSEMLDPDDEDNLLIFACSCNICGEPYSSDKQAAVLPCGHSMCSGCARSIIQYTSRAGLCPFCQQAFYNTPKNYAIMEIVDAIARMNETRTSMAGLMCLIAWSSLSILGYAQLETPISVSTPRGDLAGLRVDYGSDKTKLYYGKGDVFLGIPYAEPPVGNMRFQKTKPICQYPGASPYNATYYRASCPQQGGCVGAPMSEDCLYLNVFSPDVNSVYKYPVMLWIHGGSMKSGCAQQYHYKGAIRNLVSRGVVVVTIQYRLGLAGFFTTFSEDFPPNRAMLDQVEAIRWVSDNIQHFGGNPYRITLFGESAGAASVSAHTYSPLTRGLFQQGIMESGVVLTCFEGALGYQELSQKRAQALCNITQDQWQSNQLVGLKDCMANVTPDQWLDLESDNLLGWQMDQDNYFMPDVPRNLAAQRPNFPVMLGSNRDEWSFFWLEMVKQGILPYSFFSKGTFELFFDMFAGYFNELEEDVMKILEATYLPLNSTMNNVAQWFVTSSDIFTGAGFTGFIIREVNAHLANGNKDVYLWEQTYGSNVGKILNITDPDLAKYNPVPHVAEIYFVWMQEDVWMRAINSGEITDFDYQLADWYGEGWTNFAKYGTPYLDGSWKPVPTLGQNEYFRIDKPDQGGLQMNQAYRYTDEVIWTKVIPALAGVYPPVNPDFNNGTHAGIKPQLRFSVCPNDHPDKCNCTQSSTTVITGPTAPVSTGGSFSPTANVISTSAQFSPPVSSIHTTQKRSTPTDEPLGDKQAMKNKLVFTVVFLIIVSFLHL